ncbi:RMD1 family protein [Geotalea uraniireducens]|uniref:DUF155 domain-containing protein n=1 Tax=Geotalea uraniireducens (strain Rf4) TaxID=351605 RepID=A5GE45_GEOUR|nr:RMD1 family protein [Geotalea uraniireducens]ABQ25700.1 protein of unknown function DUF155 [Geotalea uraniireducens Rf4]
MERHEFAAYALGGELDLNRLAASLGITRKFRWEEPMVLDPEGLRLLSMERSERKQVYLYYFGGVVFLNCSVDEIRTFSAAMTKAADEFRDFPKLKYRDDYSLRIDGGTKPAITNDYAVMPAYDVAFIGIICFVIAKSVALERIEEQLDLVLDEVEGLITLLDQGRLNLTDRKLAKLASSILNFKYRSIAHIMVLDKPEITWENIEADRLYLTMANLFELNQRYNEIKHKAETLMDITEVFTSLSHDKRAARLEWIIIILIVIEILIYLVEILLKQA